MTGMDNRGRMPWAGLLLMLLAGLGGCLGGYSNPSLGLALGMDGSLVLTDRQFIPSLSETGKPCVVGSDPAGVVAEFFREQGINAVLETVGEVEDGRCWAVTSVTYASTDDWNRHVDLWETWLEGGWGKGFFFLEPLPGHIRRVQKAAGGLEWKVTTDLLAKAGAVLFSRTGETVDVDITVTLPCAPFSVAGQGVLETGKDVDWRVDSRREGTLSLTIPPDCAGGS